MLFTDGVFVGVDPTAGIKPLHYAALDRKLNVVAMDEGDLETVLAFIAALDKTFVAVDSPQAPNRGLMGRPEVRRQFNLRPGGRTWRQWRVCEYELRRRNIRIYNTPADELDAKAWVRLGIELFRRLKKMGMRMYEADAEVKTRMLIEARAHAGFTALLEHRPFLKHTLEGRLQRQLVLYLEGVDIPNPMQALEEITRHRLLTGNLPLDVLYSHEQLDALMGAYTAYLVAVKPEKVLQLGELEEGLITLPIAELQDFYP
jgi:predicted nuclease with RNAse H fold